MFTRQHAPRITKRLAATCLLIAAVGIAGCPPPTSGLIILNNSNVMVHAVYVSPVTDRIAPDYPDHNDWGPNLIEGQTDLGYGTVITITGIPAGEYDLLAVGAHTPQFGGSIVRYVEYGVSFTFGNYRWELLPTAKSENGAEGEASLGAPAAEGEEPSLQVEFKAAR